MKTLYDPIKLKNKETEDPKKCLKVSNPHLIAPAGRLTVVKFYFEVIGYNLYESAF